MHQLSLSVKFICPPQYLDGLMTYVKDSKDDVAETFFGDICDKGEDTDFYFGGAECDIDFDEIKVELQDDTLLFLFRRKKNRFTDLEANELKDSILSEDTWREGEFPYFHQEKAEKYGLPEDFDFDVDVLNISF